MARAAPKSSPVPKLRGRIWIDTDGAAMTEAGADLLEQIEACGSLSEAARRLRFSYRRSWMLVDAMNQRWSGPLVKLSAGGRGGGGAQLTQLGRTVLGAYRDLQIRFEHFLDGSTEAFRRIAR